MSLEQTRTEDEIGFSTLINISDADKLNNWMFESIRPYLKGNILETGSGIGNISSIFVHRQIPLSLSDNKDEYGRFLKRKFNSTPYIKDVFLIDLADKDFDSSYAHLLGSFDTVFALNVLEHIDDDSRAVENCYKLLASGGQLILLLPAYQGLYNKLDKELGHFRRYTGNTMRKLLSGHFEVVRIWHFNLAGIFGWFLFGSIFRRNLITKKQIHAYEVLIPLFRLADWLTFRKIGLSVIGVGRKK
jgi:SAM-dependent methyltransferase